MKNHPVFKFYIVGGLVRDGMLGLKPKDKNYLVVLREDNEINDMNQIFNSLKDCLLQNNYQILHVPECQCIKAKNKVNNEVIDIVLARKEIYYEDFSRKPNIVVGSLYDDLIRRDFTINAIAIDIETNETIDLLGGVNDLHNKILRTPNDPNITLMEDPLRILRGFRFVIKLGFTLNDAFMQAIKNDYIWEKFALTVSTERIREELSKMFQHDTIKTLEMLSDLKNINSNAYYIIFKNIELKPITKKN